MGIQRRSMEELGRPSQEEALQAEKLPLYIVLEDIRSLLNVGSIFRSADGFGVAELILVGITGCPPHREIDKTALGATLSVAWHYCADIEEAITYLKAKEANIKIAALEQASPSEPLQKWEWHGPEAMAVIVGNEVKGVSDQALEMCDMAIEIPQAGAKHSLNVSVAAGVLMYQAYSSYLSRQEKK